MCLEVKSKCKHCGKVFAIREGFWLEHPYAETKEEWEEAAFMKEGSGIEAFCPNCKKYEIIIQHTRLKRLSDYKEIDEILNGFTLVGKIKDWKKWIEIIPKEKGVYAITRTSMSTPTFIEVGTGGFFKEKNPNVSVEELAKKWYYSNNRVMYIGRVNYDDGNPKAEKCKRTLQSRIKEYMRFGNGKKAAHQGGKYIWQLSDSEELEVWYKVCNNPQVVEREMIKTYKPFANLKSGDNS